MFQQAPSPPQEAARPATPLWRQMRDNRFTPNQILTHFGVFSPPVDVFGLAAKMGVHVADVSDRNYDGALQVVENVAQVWVHSADADVRRRFTLAHELGHLMLHDVSVVYRDATFQGTPAERQANAFAADLLMPMWMAYPMALSTGFNVAKLARMFDVSNRAMEIRLMAMGGML